MSRDKSQEKVIYANPEDSMIIIAPPGYGKTYTMAKRIEYLIKNNKLDKNRKILGLTFSNAAANEMYRKLEVQDPELKKKVKIVNYHTLCYKILRRYGYKIKYTNEFSILTEKERKHMLTKSLIEVGLNEDDLKFYLKELEDWILKNKTPASKEIAEKTSDTIEKAYQHYVQNLLSEDKIDFDLIIEKVIDLWKNNPKILELFRKNYQYLIIDEFQDTNYLQYQVFKLLVEGLDSNSSSEKLPFQCYCDPYQSIYVFQGALSKNYNIIIQDFNPQLVCLHNNHRTSSRLIQNVCLQLRENIRIENSSNEYIPLVIFKNQKEESSFLINKIKNIIKTGLGLEEICIIARSYARLEIVKKYLEKESIDFIYLKDFRSDKIENRYDAIFTKFNEIITNKIKKGKMSRIFLDMCKSNNYDTNEILIHTIYEYILGYERKIQRKNYELWQKAQLIKNDILLELNWGVIIRNKIKGKIFLSSVHQVKGLEFKYVFFIGIENYELPTGGNCYQKCRKNVKVDLSEEFNIFYVGISRAIQSLIFAISEIVLKKNELKKRAISCFLEKIDNFVKIYSYKTKKSIEYANHKCWENK